MTPHAVYIDDRSVSVQWDDRGPFVTLHEDGSVTEQWREPPGMRVVTDDGDAWGELPDAMHYPAFGKGA